VYEREREREREREKEKESFKKLAHTILGARKFAMNKVDWQVGSFRKS
jgi:hypothetical protein